MTALLDTHVLVWLAGDPRRISRAARAVIEGPDPLAVSAVIAFEYEDLRIRGRLPRNAELARLRDAFELVVLPTPASLWRHAASLPPLHGDPVDRMLIAHAVDSNLALITADRRVREYPVRSIW